MVLAAKRPFDTLGHRLIKTPEIDRYAASDQTAEDVEHLPERALIRAAGCAGYVRPRSHDLVNQPRARRARPDFHKHANAVVIRTIDDEREIDGLTCLGRDRSSR